ncbi:MAG: hypothetical protein PVG96_07540 [Desulfobacterales bacterium]
MTDTKTTLPIPVELQVRELDPKLLLACRAALHGFTAVIGPRRKAGKSVSARHACSARISSPPLSGNFSGRITATDRPL